LIKRIREQRPILHVLHEPSEREEHARADEQPATQVVVRLACIRGGARHVAKDKRYSDERRARVPGGEAEVGNGEEAESAYEYGDGADERGEDARLEDAQRLWRVSQMCRHEADDRGGDECAAEEPRECEELVEPALVDGAVRESRDDPHEGERVAQPGQEYRELLAPRARLCIQEVDLGDV